MGKNEIEQVLNISLKNENIQALRAVERKHIPVVLTIEEVRSIILNMSGIYQHRLRQRIESSYAKL